MTTQQVFQNNSELSVKELLLYCISFNFISYYTLK